jgi:hypothetical protein
MVSLLCLRKPLRREGTDLIYEGITTNRVNRLPGLPFAGEGTDLIYEGITTSYSSTGRIVQPSSEGTDLIYEGITTRRHMPPFFAKTEQRRRN